MSEAGRSLASLMVAFEKAAPAERIDFREDVLAFGSACIPPLTNSATRQPTLAASVASWLEVLAGRNPEMKPAVVRALSQIGRSSSSSIVKAVIQRLGGPDRESRARSGWAPAKVRRTAEAEVHARIIKAARERRIVIYSDLETSRGHIGRYLLNISRSEAERDHPPLTSIVVSKTTGRPGDGFLPAMIEIGFARRGEELEPVWRRAVAAVHAFWATHDADREVEAVE
jgi:hypothetical protein